MLNKNYLSDNKNLKTEVSESFHIRMKKEKPELSESVDLLMELLPDDVYARAFNNIQTFNKRGDMLLIVSGGIRQRTFLERDCIPALKEAFKVKKIQIIG